MAAPFPRASAVFLFRRQRVSPDLRCRVPAHHPWVGQLLRLRRRRDETFRREQAVRGPSRRGALPGHNPLPSAPGAVTVSNSIALTPPGPGQCLCLAVQRPSFSQTRWVTSCVYSAWLLPEFSPRHSNRPGPKHTRRGAIGRRVPESICLPQGCSIDTYSRSPIDSWLCLSPGGAVHRQYCLTVGELRARA